MLKHYCDLIFSKIVKENDYSFKNAEFGKSNTDQSYYEPSASFAQNQAKIGASSITHLHNQSENDIAEIRNKSSFLPQNMTQEEVQAMIVQQREVVESAISDVNNQINVIKNDVNLKNQIVQKSTDSE